ncbi:hypothetical protein ABPG72_000597 [Tetrahymena utriculariae]
MEQISLQVEKDLEEAINILNKISSPQEEGFILTDILINDICFLRSLIFSGKEESLNNYLEDIKTILDKAKEIKNNLSVSNTQKHQNLYLILQLNPVNVIFQKINIILQIIKKKLPKQIDINDFYNLNPKNVEQLFQTPSELQNRLKQNVNQSKPLHQLTALFQICRNQQEQKKLLNSFVSFILPTCDLQSIDYDRLFKMLGIENINQVKQEKSLQLLNHFFKNCWLNRKYLLRLFKPGQVLNQNKQLIIEQYVPIRYLKLKIFKGDFEEQIESSQILNLQVNKLQIIGEKKVNDMKYEPRVNEMLKYQLFIVEPYCFDYILLTPLKDPLNCLIGEDQEINLNYGEQMKEYIIFHEEKALKLVIKMEKEISQKNLKREKMENEIKQKHGQYQDKIQKLETDQDINCETSTQQTDDLEEIKEYDSQMNNLFNLQDKQSAAIQPFYFYAYTFKIALEFQKGHKNGQNFQKDQNKEFFLDEDHSFQYQLTENVIFQIIYDKLTQQLKIKQVFKQSASNLTQKSFLEVPRTSTILIQKETVLFSEYQKYKLIFN